MLSLQVRCSYYY